MELLPEKGTLVQVDPEAKNISLGGCVMIVKEIVHETDSARCCLIIPGQKGTHSRYFDIPVCDLECVGKPIWFPNDIVAEK